MGDFETKDSGARQSWDSGMQRDTQDGKARFDLMIPEGVPYADQLLTRFAELLARGAAKYEDRNWEKANSEDEIARAKSSAFRHFMQWLCGEEDEDHAVATIFNLLVVETTRTKLERQAAEEATVLNFGPFETTTLTFEAQDIDHEVLAMFYGGDIQPHIDAVNDVTAKLAEAAEVPTIFTDYALPARFIVGVDGTTEDQRGKTVTIPLATEAGEPEQWIDDDVWERNQVAVRRNPCYIEPAFPGAFVQLDRDLVEGDFGPDLLKKHPSRWERG